MGFLFKNNPTSQCWSHVMGLVVTLRWTWRSQWLIMPQSHCCDTNSTVLIISNVFRARLMCVLFEPMTHLCGGSCFLLISWDWMRCSTCHKTDKVMEKKRAVCSNSWVCFHWDGFVKLLGLIYVKSLSQLIICWFFIHVNNMMDMIPVDYGQMCLVS